MNHDPASPATPAVPPSAATPFSIFEVEAHGTLRLHGGPESGVHAVLNVMGGQAPHAGAQGQALLHFEQMPQEARNALGVELVYDDRPGSSYGAAKLRLDLMQANITALIFALDIRFVREGQVQAAALSEPDTATVPAAALRVEVEPEASTEDPDLDLTPFSPLFGVRPDIGWMVDLGPGDPLPVAALRYLHLPWLFQSAWRRIVDTIREPVRVHVGVDGRRHVQVLAGAVYTTDGDGRLSGGLWTPNDGLDPILERADPGGLTVDGVPWRWRWLNRWQQAFTFEVEAMARVKGHADLPQEARAYAVWAFGVFRSRIRRRCDLRVMRGRIAEALQLDAVALTVTRQLCMTGGRESLANMAVYNRAVEFLAAHRKLERDAPRLHLTYALLCHGGDELVGPEPAGDEPLQRMRRRVKARGLSGRTWKLLLAGGTSIWRPMVRFYTDCDTDEAWDYLTLIDAMGWRDVPDAAVMHLVLAQWGSSDRRRNSYAARFASEMRVLTKIVQRYEGLDRGGRDVMCADLSLVLTWLGKKDAAPVRGASRVPAWATLVRQAQAFERDRMRVAEAASGPWPRLVLVDPRVDAGVHEVVLLRGAGALRDEGVAMRHCALSYARDCAAGRAVVASVRDRETGKRVATVLWEQDEGRWTLREMVGFANGPVSARVRAVAMGIRIV